jgi:YggT family protein
LRLTAVLVELSVIDLFRLAGGLVQLYLLFIMLPMALMSWFRIQPGTPMARVQLFLYRATEPILAPVRRVIRPIGSIDISFIVVFLVLQYVVVGVLFR